MRGYARVCAIGTPQQIDHILEYMYRLAMDPDVEELPGRSRLLTAVYAAAERLGGAGDQFLYEMIAPRPWGDACPGTCRMLRQDAPAGLQTLLLTYQSERAIQLHDFLQLHQLCGKPLISALYASSDFCQEKGQALFLNGKCSEIWDHMASIWLWLCLGSTNLSSEEQRGLLTRLARTLREEEWDEDVPQLLSDTEALLHRIDQSTSDAEALASRMERCLAEGDFGQLLSCRLALADRVLWDIDHLDTHLAHLRQLSALAANLKI